MGSILHHEVKKRGSDAPWLVFIHGAGGGISTWKYQKEAFAPYFNLLFIDLRDHGKSKNIQPEYNSYDFRIVSEDILRVIDQLGIRKASFVSLSLGSILLQKLDEMRPELVERMVAAGGIFKPNLKIHLFAHAGKFLSYILSYRQIYHLFSWVVMPRKNHEKARRVYRLQSERLSPGEFMKWLGLYQSFFRELRHFFRRELVKPCLVIMGSQDHVFLDAAKEFVRRQPKAVIEIVEQCGHIVTIDKPEIFNKKTIQFLLSPPSY